MNQPTRLMYFPISIFAMIMGLSGLTIAYEKAENILAWTIQPSLFFLALTSLLFLLLALMYVAKFIRHPQAVKQEFKHPIKVHFFPAMSISLILLSIAYYDVHVTTSFWLWFVGAVWHLLLTLTIVTMWIQHTTFDIKHMNPSWFIPAVGNILVPVVGVQHASSEISWLFFSIGAGFWIILLVIFFNRIIFHHPMPEKLLPTLFILIAPPAVGFIAYIKLTGELDAFARMLYYFGLFTLMLLLVQLPLLTKVKFYLSWWAYSFPMAAITIASFLMFHLTQLVFYKWLGGVLLVILSVLILGLLIRTLMAIRRHEICVEEG